MRECHHVTLLGCIFPCLSGKCIKLIIHFCMQGKSLQHTIWSFQHKLTQYVCNVIFTCSSPIAWKISWKLTWEQAYTLWVDVDRYIISIQRWLIINPFNVSDFILTHFKMCIVQGWLGLTMLPETNILLSTKQNNFSHGFYVVPIMLEL